MKKCRKAHGTPKSFLESHLFLRGEGGKGAFERERPFSAKNKLMRESRLVISEEGSLFSSPRRRGEAMKASDRQSLSGRGRLRGE